MSPRTSPRHRHGFSRVYRAVSEAEYEDILQASRFGPGPNSLEGKWFSDSLGGPSGTGRACIRTATSVSWRRTFPTPQASSNSQTLMDWGRPGIFTWTTWAMSYRACFESVEVIDLRAIVEWLTKEQGGRAAPPAGVGSPPYAPVVRFTDEPWPAPVAWSLAVGKVDAAGDPRRWVADVQFLVPEAPHGSLRDGRDFELYEGRRLVARGRITANPADLPNKQDFAVPALT